jgi:DNA-directed RNA polymerase II subunit RPB2
MPFTDSGLKPDIIINPHAIPSRMTVGQLIETLLGKVLLELGMFGDGTSFTDEFSSEEISKRLQKLNYESHGNEMMYDGISGRQIESKIFIGPAFYQRLKHMVVDKQHSRSIGPMVNLTRQPAEGRARDGGLRFGEMERDCVAAHGITEFTKERFMECSDAFPCHVCRECGLLAVANPVSGIWECKACNNTTNFSSLQIPYATKLLIQELETMCIAPRILTQGKLIKSAGMKRLKAVPEENEIINT